MKEEFAEGWVTFGYCRINGKWAEVGSIPGITADNQKPPELGVHDVPEKLNMLECRIRELNAKCGIITSTI